MLCLVAQSCLTLCNPMNCNLPGSFVHGDFPGKNTRVGCHALLQGISSTQASNPGLPHCRQIIYHLSHQGSLWILEQIAYLLKGIFPTQESNWGLLYCRRILDKLSSQGSLRGIAWWIKKFLFALALTRSDYLLIGYSLQSSLHHIQDGWKWLVCQACLFLCEMRTGREARKLIILCVMWLLP